jgi:exodeoxyribonuclease VII large subunit
MDLERRFIRSFDKGLDDRRRHLGQLARVLPRADQLFAVPRQRFDVAGERLQHALRQNLHKHREALAEMASQLRPRRFIDRVSTSRNRTTTIGHRLAQAHFVHLAKLRQALDGAVRMMESVSYRAVLDRGFALVRTGEGHIHRRAAAIEPGEVLALTFTDGTTVATAAGGTVPEPPPPRRRPVAKKSSDNQGSLF